MVLVAELICTDICGMLCTTFIWGDQHLAVWFPVDGIKQPEISQLTTKIKASEIGLG